MHGGASPPLGRGVPSWNGETGALLRAGDWAGSELGPPETWPASLEAAVSLIMASRFPMFVAWGETLPYIYNDACIPIVGDRHPAALGRPFREVWPDVWDDLAPLLQRALDGEACYLENLPLTLRRDGRPTPAYFTFSYSPLRDENGTIRGVFSVAVENTAAVQAARRERFRLELEDALRSEPDPARVMEAASALLGRHLGAARCGYGEVDGTGRHVVVDGSWSDGCLPAMAGRWLLDEYGPALMADLRAGRPARVQDSAADPRLHADAAEAHLALGMQASLTQPLMRDGRLAALLFANQPEPRAWTPDEESLLREVAERTWAAVERARSEAALRESEDHYRHAAELNPQVAWTAGPDGQLDRVAERWEDWTGTSGVGDGWARGLHPDDVPRTAEAWGRSVATGVPYDVEHRVRHRSGVHRWARSRAYPRRDGAGLIVKWYGSTEDVHERKVAEERLRGSEARLRLALSAARMGEVVFDLARGSVSHSPAFAALLGRGPDAALRLDDIRASYHPDDAGRVMAEREAILAGGLTFYEVEHRVVWPDGSVRWVAGRGEVSRAADGTALAVTAVYMDITRKRAAEEELRRFAQTLEAQVAARTAERDRIWQLSRDLMCVARIDGTLVSVNPAWERLLGWPPAWLEGRNAAEIKHPEDAERTAAELARLAEGRPTHNFEDRYRHRDGSWRRISWVIEPEGDLIYCIGRDVTAEKAAAAELERAQDALRQAQKMETVGQLTGGIAHDFNNLLQVVVGNLEILERNLPADAPRMRRCVDGAMTGARRAAVLTQRLLAFSRRQPLQPKPTGVNQLVVGMSDLLNRTLGETIEVETRLAAGLWRILADPNQLENALLNLAVNARDAMPEGGLLVIETRNARLDRPEGADRDEVEPGPYVVVDVTDTGSGMEAATLERVFEPFFTTKEVGKGTGLGLSMVYGFVRQSGGHVRLRSQPGRGTTVSLCFPRLVAEEAAEEAALPASVPDGASHEFVLVVEDDDDVRRYSVEVLQELGYRVAEAPDGPTALRLLGDGAGGVDLLFSDVVLPGGMTGADLAREARRLKPELRVLFTTGYARDAIVHEGRLDEGVTLLPKPFTYAELAARVRDVLDGTMDEALDGRDGARG